jgi:hypothetical protein
MISLVRQAIVPLWALLDNERHVQKKALLKVKRRKDAEKQLMENARSERKRFLERTKGKPALHACGDVSS